VSTKDYVEKDYYAALGVSKDAGQGDIKRAYRKLARQFHPDANKSNPEAEERFKEISEAYAVLSDEKRRKEYDEARALFGSGGFRYPSGARTGGPGGFTFDLGDLFGQPGGAGVGGLGDVLGNIFTRPRGGSTAQARRGADVETEVTLDFADAVEGVTVPLRMTSDQPCRACAGTGARAGTTPRVCPECEGTGLSSRNLGGFAFSEPCRMCRGRGLVVDDPCQVCHGSGRAPSTRTMNVRIPAGVQNVQRIRLKGEHLTITVPVTFPEAALGAEIKVPTLGAAPVTVKLPPGTANGRTLRVRGRGAPRKDGTRGDLLVTVAVAVPQKLSDSARDALKAFQEATAGENPRRDLGTGEGA
jgi:molecular chaperone DnaJ